MPQKVNHKLRVVLEVTTWRMQAQWAVGLCGDKGCGDWLVLESVDPRGLTREQPSCTCCARCDVLVTPLSQVSKAVDQ